MKLFALLALLAFAATGPAIAAASPSASAAAPSAAVPPADAADLDAVSTKLNATKTLQARFTQVDSQGTATGQFYLARPGGLRFEYNPPRHLLVVANNRLVVVQEIKGTAGYDARIEDTPLRLLLKPDVDLAKDADIADVHRDGRRLYVTAVQTKGYGQGQVTFVFDEPSLQLERWVITDPTGAQTMVTLSDLKVNAPLSASLFELPQVQMPVGPPR
jgi:outer membrane lipoprotein-sorting protein